MSSVPHSPLPSHISPHSTLSQCTFGTVAGQSSLCSATVWSPQSRRRRVATASLASRFRAASCCSPPFEAVPPSSCPMSAARPDATRGAASSACVETKNTNLTRRKLSIYPRSRARARSRYRCRRGGAARGRGRRAGEQPSVELARLGSLGSVVSCFNYAVGARITSAGCPRCCSAEISTRLADRTRARR